MNGIFVKNLKPAKRYAMALLDIASNFSVDEIFENLKFAVELIKENDEAQAFFENPVISKKDKKEVVGQIFEGKVLTPVLNFLNLLIENDKFDIVEDVLYCFEREAMEANNVVKAFVSSAIELSEIQKDKIKQTLEQKLSKNVVPEFLTDEGILGGFVIKINDTVIDLSLKKKISNLKNLIER